MPENFHTAAQIKSLGGSEGFIHDGGAHETDFFYGFVFICFSMFKFTDFFLPWNLGLLILAAPYPDEDNVVKRDILLPYDSWDATKLLKTHDRHRVTRECQPIKYGEEIFEVYPAHHTVPHTLPVLEHRLVEVDRSVVEKSK